MSPLDDLGCAYTYLIDRQNLDTVTVKQSVMPGCWAKLKSVRKNAKRFFTVALGLLKTLDTRA